MAVSNLISSSTQPRPAPPPGTFWGALIGMIFLVPLAGAAIGAASGAISGVLADVGINDRFMKDAAQSLQSGNATLFLLIRTMTTDKVLAALQGEGGTVIRTSFDDTKEEALRTALAGATRPPRRLQVEEAARRSPPSLPAGSRRPGGCNRTCSARTRSRGGTPCF